MAEIPVTQAIYVDILADDEVSLNSQLVSLYWYAPPDDLKAIMPFPNGIAVGLQGQRGLVQRSPTGRMPGRRATC